MENYIKRELAINTSRELIKDEGFKGRHRQNETDFTRNRILSFGLVLVLVLRNSVKSLQSAVVLAGLNIFLCSL